MHRHQAEEIEIEDFVRRRVAAAEEFNQHEGRSDGVEVAGSLAGGLTILRDARYKRLHGDVQRAVGPTRSSRRFPRKKASGWRRSRSNCIRLPFPRPPPATSITSPPPTRGIGNG